MLCSQLLRAGPVIRYADLGSMMIVVRSHFAPFLRRSRKLHMGKQGDAGHIFERRPAPR